MMSESKVRYYAKINEIMHFCGFNHLSWGDFQHFVLVVLHCWALCRGSLLIFQVIPGEKNQMYYYRRRVGRPSQSKTQPRALRNIWIQTVLKRSPSGASALEDAAVRNWASSYKSLLKVILRSKTVWIFCAKAEPKPPIQRQLYTLTCISSRSTLSSQWKDQTASEIETISATKELQWKRTQQLVVCYSHNSLNATRLQFWLYCILHLAIQLQKKNKKNSWTRHGSYFSGRAQIAAASLWQNITVSVTSTFFERHFLTHTRRPETLSARVASRAPGKRWKWHKNWEF